MASPPRPSTDARAFDRWAPLAPDGIPDGQFRDRSRHSRRPERTRLDPYPRDPLWRWLMRLVYALPFVAVAVINRLTPTGGTVNAQLVQKVASIDWSRADARWMADIFPPISTLVAAVTPGGVFGLAILGAISAGVFLQKIIEIMVQRRLPVSTIIILVVALAANPLFFFSATENFSGFIGLAFCGLGLAHIVRFVVWRNTQSGFRAGILLMLAALTSPSGPLYVVTAAVAAPFLALGRKGQSGARWANVLVIVYPTAAALGSLLVLNLVFLGHPFSSIRVQEFAGVDLRIHTILTLFTTVSGWLFFAPVVAASLIALIVRSPGSIITAALVFLAQVGAHIVGLLPPAATGSTFILMTLLAMALIPTARSSVENVLVDLVAAGQILIGWFTAINSPVILPWMQNVESVVGHILR